MSSSVPVHHPLLLTDFTIGLAMELRLRRVPFVFASGYGVRTVDAEFQDVLLWEKPLDIPAMARRLSGLIQEQQLG